MSKFVWTVTAALVLHVIGATGSVCPSDANCICGGRPAVELKCNIDGKDITINLLPNTYLNIKCGHVPNINYSKFPKLSANRIETLKSVTFKDCPLPSTSFKEVLNSIGVSKTMSLIFQNSKNLTSYLDRKQFEGLQDLTKLLLSVSSTTHIPDNLFIDMQNLTWLNIRSNGNNLSRKLFEPLEKLETLEISHNGKTNITSNVFSHLTLLRKLSLWQSNVTRFSEDLFNGVEVLEELDLSSNGLNELPPSIFNPLRKLKKLTLFSNKFSTLPAELFKNNVDLDTVIIFNNDVKLKTLPKGLFKSKQNLNEVYIQRCALEDIPKDLFSNSPRISNISLAHNEIEKLPEAIFNDQINLLDLDLSHNQINKLEPKIFSSLVRLERLQLSYNCLHELSGSTFLSLLSLEYLNLEHNNLKTINSYLFVNNKQRMTIIASHNQLGFGNSAYQNDSVMSVSPFANIFNMKLLDLSHNAIQGTFDDWWYNGHEILDISHNNITKLQSINHTSKLHGKGTIKENYQKPLKQIHIGHNPIACTCQNALFLTQLQEQKTKGASTRQLNCGYLQLSFCEKLVIAYLYLISITLVLFLLTLSAIIGHRRQIHDKIKTILYEINKTNVHKKKSKQIIISYSDKDEEFVLQKLLPGLHIIDHTILLKPVSTYKKCKNLAKTIRNSVKDLDDLTITVLTPNYLKEAYCDIDVKKIRSELSKNKQTIFIYVDLDPENSLFTYLKGESDPRHTIHWEKANFWDNLSQMINARVFRVRNCKGGRFLNWRVQGSFERLHDCPDISSFDTLTQCKV